jgi:hypothetical protein
MSRVSLVTCDLCNKLIADGAELRYLEVRVGHSKTNWGYSQHTYDTLDICLKDVHEACYRELMRAMALTVASFQHVHTELNIRGKL